MADIDVFLKKNGIARALVSQCKRKFVIYVSRQDRMKLLKIQHLLPLGCGLEIKTMTWMMRVGFLFKRPLITT